jgi:galactonate dehydratase
VLRVASVAAHSVRVTPRTIWTFARVAAEDGTEGWGEGTLQGRSEQVQSKIQAFDARLRGRSFAAPSDLGPVPEDLIQAAAHSAVEQALWDLAARAAGRPLAELLGAVKRSRIELYANINRGTVDRSPAGFAARAAEAAAAGFRAIKIAPFDGVTQFEKGSIEAGYARIAAAAQAIAGRAEPPSR